MSQTEPSTVSIVTKKALKSSQKECLTFDGPPKWKDSPNECQFPFHYNGEEHKGCTTVGKTQPWCATIVKKNTSGHHVPSDKGGENWWGYCGNCRGEVDKRCQAGGHVVLTDKWRAIKGEGSVGGRHYDDSKLSANWYKFEIPGRKNIFPAYNHGVEPAEHCQSMESHAHIELPSSGELTAHDEDEKDFRFCFDANCNNFKMIDVLWCPPQVHNQKPFYIYKLKPSEVGQAYCVL